MLLGEWILCIYCGGGTCWYGGFARVVKAVADKIMDELLVAVPVLLGGERLRHRIHQCQLCMSCRYDL
jgi:hypothetical protein